MEDELRLVELWWVDGEGHKFMTNAPSKHIKNCRKSCEALKL